MTKGKYITCSGSVNAYFTVEASGDFTCCIQAGDTSDICYVKGFSL